MRDVIYYGRLRTWHLTVWNSLNRKITIQITKIEDQQDVNCQCNRGRTRQFPLQPPLMRSSASRNLVAACSMMSRIVEPHS